jgi:hypothetical protein
MTRQRTGNNHMEARAEGREAFWAGRVVMVNPHVGADARLWTAAWRAAETDFLTRSGAARACPGRQYPLDELARFRPSDIPEAPRKLVHSPKGRGNKGKGKPAGLVFGDPSRHNQPSESPASTRFLPGDTPWKST